MGKSFYQFLMAKKVHKEVDDVTKLANLVFNDIAFPRQSSNFEEVSNYLETHAEFSFNLSKFDEIWQEYIES
ncbi:YozE family protein [Floricoccus penangensis]|uniref:UPF0346 protein BG262_04130 n=1 Tax=Floricoccus penangensis TaxID=1859475 RepID=A0A9Q5JF85_9LACT|nr:YozE family protein [Floricoccus penangensis]OFI46210.1 hypothetical protein BG262_04130 [Floricoccus penangensis]URZ86930.1 YozE family protein [Floricoccus penangensis]